jgi:hypothetical protein
MNSTNQCRAIQCIREGQIFTIIHKHCDRIIKNKIDKNKKYNLQIIGTAILQSKIVMVKVGDESLG